MKRDAVERIAKVIEQSNGIRNRYIEHLEACAECERLTSADGRKLVHCARGSLLERCVEEADRIIDEIMGHCAPLVKDQETASVINRWHLYRKSRDGKVVVQ